MAKGLIDLLLDNIFDDAWTGKYGEMLTANELGWAKLFGKRGKTLRNVYLPAKEGETSELDVIYITQKGIFIFESKNFSGWIFGDEKSRQWTASLPNGYKNHFYNPIMQNRTHLKWMHKFVGDDIPLFSIVVFSERCELKKISVYSEDVKVIKRDRVYATIREYWEKNPDVVSNEKINELYENLKKFCNVDEAVKAAHIQNIEEKYKDEEVKVKLDIPGDISTADNRVSQEIKCPICGKELILRTAKKGGNAGKKFYGCSGYPNCRYIQNL